MARQVIANHIIERTRKPGKPATATEKAVRPVIEKIQPGTAFVIDDETEYKRLKDLKAIRDPVKKSAVDAARDSVRSSGAADLDNGDAGEGDETPGKKSGRKSGGRKAAQKPASSAEGAGADDDTSGLV